MVKLTRADIDANLAARGIDRWGFPLRPGLVAQPAPDAPTPDDVPRRGRQAGPGSHSPTLDAGLRRLCAEARPHQLFTRNEIAAACGVRKDTIRLLERQALRKLRRRLGPLAEKQLRELVKF